MPFTAMLAEQHTVFTHQASLPLAETASTFGEMMLVDRLLAEETDDSVRRDLLFKQVDDAYATILRQAFFALFERQAHELTARGRLGRRALRGLPGESQGPIRRCGGSQRRVPLGMGLHPAHLPDPLLRVCLCLWPAAGAFALPAVQEEGESFKPRYLKILSAGGSEAPVQILAEAGIDIYQASFWQGGFDVLEGLVKQLEDMESPSMTRVWEILAVPWPPISPNEPILPSPLPLFRGAKCEGEGPGVRVRFPYVFFD